MLRIFTIILFLVINIFAEQSLRPSSYLATAYAIKEIGSKDPLMSKNLNQKLAPASLTKVLTCTIALEISNPNAQVTVPREATLVEPTRAGFKEGEVFAMQDLIEAALVHSANDAAYTIAYHIGGGDINKFVDLMNAKAASLGMTNSNFTNPAGFDIGDHHTTAADLLKLAEYAIKNKTFNDIVKQQSVEIVSINSGKKYKMHTSNKLLGRYPYALGIKTGFTNKAGPCLIARTKTNNRDLIIVLLKSQASRWTMVDDIVNKAGRMQAPEPEIIDNSSPGASYQRLASKNQAAKKQRIANTKIQKTKTKNVQVVKKDAKKKKQVKNSQ